LGLPEGPIRAWITFFKHWQEELTMADVAHEPVKKAMSRIRELSADEEARRLAFVRERALRDEVSLLNDAEKRGRMEGRTEGRMETMRETARNLINRTEMDDTMIAEISGLPVESVTKLRSETKH
jgi:predicted transposase/invertase (TIGR01784 family)